MLPEDLVGAWRLVRFTVDAPHRAPRHPFGPDARGLLVYTADGHVSAVLSRAARPPLGGDLERAHRAGGDAKIAAFDGYLSYAGRWRLDGDRVVHSVELALVPDVVGAEQVRRARLDGDRLRLEYQRTGRDGRPRTFRLEWTR